MSSFAELVKMKREQKGLSLNALAKECGIDASYISRLEQGANKQPSFTNAMKLAKALNIMQDDLSQAFDVQELNRSDIENFRNEEKIANKNEIIEIIENMADKSNFSIKSITNLLKEVNKFVNKKRKHIVIAINQHLTYIVELDYFDNKINSFLRGNFQQSDCREVIYMEGQLVGVNKYDFNEIVNLFLDEQSIDEDEANKILVYYERKVIENEHEKI
ncbi:helix-turn-helix domain-containing protein [Clostridium tagluense]|uniref:helix-turn-helix domain-containing protein n=1 Tax=Clostridium tagluense TaxID=360422 RepID=UPI001C0DBBD8|nr:helix-turn-helix domain-containing protein [Clostridium tagluense]MBU3129076.1 helix-turn-helix domain-containing protein [Clostridium tagluense]